MGSSSQLFVGLAMTYHSRSLHDIGLNFMKDGGIGGGYTSTPDVSGIA